MRGILHEKIQLYIYKPSINKFVANPAPGFEPGPRPRSQPHLRSETLHIRKRISHTKINSPYYGEFTESLS
jgi:hypothetical protein